MPKTADTAAARRVTFTRHAPASYEEGSSYDILDDGVFVGEITSEVGRDMATDRHVVFGYVVDLHGADAPEAFTVRRVTRDWGRGGVSAAGDYPTARAALAAAKAHARTAAPALA